MTDIELYGWTEKDIQRERVRTDKPNKLYKNQKRYFQNNKGTAYRIDQKELQILRQRDCYK